MFPLGLVGLSHRGSRTLRPMGKQPKDDPQKMKAAFCTCLSRQENPWLNVFVTF